MRLNPVVDGVYRGAARIERAMHRHVVATLATAAVLLTLNELNLFGPDVSQWDWMFVSGWLTAVLGLLLALGLPAVAAGAIERLSKRRILEGSDADLRSQVTASAETWSKYVGPAVAVLTFAAFVAAFGVRALTSHAMFTLLATVAGLLVGRVVGRGLALGQLGRRIENGEWRLEVQPDHIDGAAGLKPVGELYFKQAMVLAIPPLYLGVWWVLIPIVGKYAYWRAPYLALLAVAVAVEVAAFLLPMLAFHRIMRQEKQRLLVEVDEHSAKLHRFEFELPDITDDARRQSVAEQVTLLRERYLRIEGMPTWPVNASLRRRFGFNNALLLLPVVAKALGVALPGGDLIPELGKIFDSS